MIPKVRATVEAGRTDLEVPADDEPVAIVVESRQHDIDTVDLSIKPDDGYKFIDTPFDAQSLASSFALPPEVINSGEVGYNRAAIHALAVAWDPKSMAKNIGAGVLTDEQRKKFAEQTSFRGYRKIASENPVIIPDRQWADLMEHTVDIVRLAVSDSKPALKAKLDEFACFLQSQGADAEATRLREIAVGTGRKYKLTASVDGEPREVEFSTGGIDRAKFGLPEETEPREVKVTIRNGQSLTVKIVADNTVCVDISSRVAADSSFLSAVLAAGLNKYDIKEYQPKLGGWRVELNGAHSAFFLSADGKLTELQ